MLKIPLCFNVSLSLSVNTAASVWCIDWVRETLCETNFNVCCIKDHYLLIYFTSGPRVKICRQLKCFKPPVTYVTNCSKAMVLLLFLFCVALWVLVRSNSCWVLSYSLFSCLSVLLALWSPRLGKRELVYMFLVHLFVYFACVNVCPFSLPLGGQGWLRLLIVALPGFPSTLNRNP